MGLGDVLLGPVLVDGVLLGPEEWITVDVGVDILRPRGPDDTLLALDLDAEVL